jgi:hypothetical protein
VELLIGSILPAGSHSCPLQSVDAEQCRAAAAGRRSAQASLAVQRLDGLERLDVADRVVTGSWSCGVTRNRFQSWARRKSPTSPAW